MTQNTKNILIGIVIGAIIVAGGQYAWSKYQDGVKAKELSVSMQGLKTATNKTAYLNSYFSSQPKPTKNVSVGLSNSSASEGGYCEDVVKYQDEIYDYMSTYCRKEGNTDPLWIDNNGTGYCNLAAEYYEQALRGWVDNCVR